MKALAYQQRVKAMPFQDTADLSHMDTGPIPQSSSEARPSSEETDASESSVVSEWLSENQGDCKDPTSQIKQKKKPSISAQWQLDTITVQIRSVSLLTLGSIYHQWAQL